MATVHQLILEPCSKYCESPHFHTVFFSEDTRAVAVQRMLSHAASVQPTTPSSLTHDEIVQTMRSNNYFAKFKAVALTAYARNLESVLALLPADSVAAVKVVQLYADILESCCTAHVNHHIFSTLFAYLYRSTLPLEYTTEVRLLGGVICRECF